MEGVDLGPEVMLNRFIYLSSTDGRYVPGCPFTHDCYTAANLSFINNLIDIEKNIDGIVTVITEAIANAKSLPRRSNLVFVLAYCCRLQNPKMREICYKLTARFCESMDDFMLFVKFCNQLNAHGWGEGMRNTVKRWYLSKDHLTLAHVLGSGNSRYGWSHKDILTLARPKGTDPTYEVLLAFAVRGYNDAIKKPLATPEVLASPAMTYLTDLNNFKSCEKPELVAQLLTAHKFTLAQVTAHMLKQPVVWAALVENFSLKEVLRNLQRLHNMGYLTRKDNSNFVLSKVIKVLKNSTLLEESNIHPIEVVISYHNYINRGRILKYPQLQHQLAMTQKGTYIRPNEPNEEIKSLLYKMIDSSMRLYTPSTQSRFLVTVDFREEVTKEKCFYNGNIDICVAAATLALSLCRAQRRGSSFIAVFTDSGIMEVLYKSNNTVAELTKRLNAAKSGYTLMCKPMEWALKQKKEIDCFVNIFDSPYRITKVPRSIRSGLKDPIDMFIEYRNAMKPRCKFVSISLSEIKVAVARSKPTAGCIDLCGLDENTPKIIEAFCNDYFE